jgi:integrase
LISRKPSKPFNLANPLQARTGLPYKTTKERKAKTIPINHHLQNIFDSQPRALHHGYVFTYRGNAFAEGGIKRSFKTACINAGVPYGRKTENGLTFHDIRRTVKTYMLKAGVNKIYRDLILGHSLRGMDAFYLKPDDDDLKQALDVYTQWFDEQLESEEKGLMKKGVKLRASKIQPMIGCYCL